MKLKLITLFLCCFCLANMWSQNSVSGTVIDESNIPLPGVSIVIKGTSVGVVSDFDGNFNIKVEQGNILSFLYLGYKQQDITIESQQKITVVMTDDASELDEIVIVGYGRQKKESVLGAINQVKGAALLESGAQNVSSALNGISAGVNVVQSSGQPGSEGGEIFIRGNADPLILVDGVEIVGGFENMDPRDIETISVLKDGAATSVYGIRGANGVIIITTKRGRIGAPTVSFTTEYTVKTVSNSPDMLDAYSAESAYNIGLLNDEGWDQGYNSVAALQHYKDGDLPWLYPNTDWQDTILEDHATSLNGTFAVRGGTEKVKYYASASFLQEGNIAKSEQLYNYDNEFSFKRYAFRGNLDFNLSKTTRLKTSVSGRLEDQNAPRVTATSFLALYSGSPGGMVPVYPEEVLELYPDPAYPEGFTDTRYGAGDGGNLYQAINASGSLQNINTVFSMDFELEQDLDFITEGLTFTGKFNQITNFKTQRTTLFDNSKEVRVDAYTLLPDGTWDSLEGRNYERPLEYVINNEGIGPNTNKAQAAEQINTYRAQLFYDHSFGDHNVTVLAIWGRNKAIRGTQFAFYTEDWISRATYNYKSKYFVEASGTYNGDETFAEGYRFQFFPSASAGVNLAKGNFMTEHLPVVNNFKIRYSYGETGSKAGLKINGVAQRWVYDSSFGLDPQDREASRYFFGVDNVDVQPVDRMQTISQIQMGNAKLTWATVTKQNIGVDWGLLNNKISGSVDFFKDHRTGLISRQSAAPYYFGSDVALPFGNLGESESRGYEVSLSYNNTFASGFKFGATAFYAFNDNRVIASALDAANTASYATVAGKPKATSLLLQTDGYFQSIDELVNYPSYSNTTGLGDYRYVDYNANGTVLALGTEDLLRYNLPDSPKHSFSLKLNAGYKRWSMNALINGINGHKGLINSTLSYALPEGSIGAISSGRVDQLDYWTPTNRDAAYPALHLAFNPNLAADHTARIVNLDYIKLRSINIAYDFDMTNSNSVNNLKVYISGNNLITISELDFGDPSGDRPGQHPTLSRFNLGINVGF